MDSSERIQAAASFILQAPPGEINDVLNDVRTIIADDDALQTGVLPALREYNLAQFTPVDVPGAAHQSIVSAAALLTPGAEAEVDTDAEERFVDPRSHTSFRFDHLSLEASDPQPAAPDAETEPLRVALEGATLTYLAAHFRDGVASVFSASDARTRFTLQIVANKYNPSNYWAGRWRAEYAIDLGANTVRGRIRVHVHYYEQGNVQLATEHAVSLTLPAAVASAAPGAAAAKILALIADAEGRYQGSLNDTYREMGETTFKGLRRALPLTRQKIDWDKVLGYKLGAELTAAKGGLGSS